MATAMRTLMALAAMLALLAVAQREHDDWKHCEVPPKCPDEVVRAPQQRIDRRVWAGSVLTAIGGAGLALGISLAVLDRVSRVRTRVAVTPAGVTAELHF